MQSLTSCCRLLPLVLVALALAAAAGSANGEIITRNWAQSFDAGDQFGAVVVCGNKPAFVGGFREDEAKRSTANVIASVNLAERSFPTPLVANLSVAVKGGWALAPGNGRRVYAMAEKDYQINVFNLNENCTNWDNNTYAITFGKYSPVSLMGAATIGSSLVSFAGGVREQFRRGTPEIIDVTTYGIYVNTTTDNYDSFRLSEGRAGLVGVSLPDEAWYVGGMDAYLNVVDVVDVVTPLGDDQVNVNSTRFTLSEPRVFAAGVYAHGKVFIAGGASALNVSSDSSNITATFSRVVDIFDVGTGVRNTTTLPGPARGFLTAVATDEFVYFAAGVTAAAYTYNTQDVIYQNTTDVIDIYHIATGTWSSSLKLAGGARMYASGVSIPETNVAFFAPGSFYPNGSSQRNYTNKVDVVFVAETSSAASSLVSPIMIVVAFIASSLLA